MVRCFLLFHGVARKQARRHGVRLLHLDQRLLLLEVAGVDLEAYVDGDRLAKTVELALQVAVEVVNQSGRVLSQLAYFDVFSASELKCHLREVSLWLVLI